MHNRKKDIDKRIKYIAYFKKPKFIWTGIGVTAAIIIGIVCLTNPIGKSDKSNNVDGVGYGKSLPMANTDSLLKETVGDGEIEKLSPNENSESGQFTIDQLTRAVLENDIQLVNEIIKDSSVDINEVDSEGKYPIEMVLVMDNCDMAKILLEAKADPYVTTSNGKSVYDIVMESGSKYLKEIFMEYTN